jgi:rubrerythrin
MRRRLLEAVLAGLWTTAARADTALDVQILQTACSLEALAVAAYDLALAQAPGVVTAFALETRRQHEEHKRAFQAQTTALDPSAKVQDAANPKFLPALTGADLSTPQKLVDFAAQLEKVATDTYLLNLTLLQDDRTKALMGSVMGVEAQHLAALRVFGSLLEANAPQLVTTPDMIRLPPATGRLAFPEALHRVGGPDRIAEPSSGALA